MERSPDIIREVEVDTDWQRNWHASLAIKVTAPLLWIIVIASIAFSIITQRNIEDELQQEFELSADWIAYQLNTNIDSDNFAASTRQLIEAKFKPYFTPNTLTGFSFEHQSQRIEYGDNCAGLAIITRPVLLHFNHPQPELLHSSATLTLCHLPIVQLAKQQRKKALLFFGGPFLLLGFLLAGVVHIVVTRPIQDMVKITKKIAEGDMEIRMDETRQDEFGDLARFSNRMVDSLNQKHGELRDAVDTANRASKAKSIFLANMSHELRTPLNAIIGYAELIGEESFNAGHKTYSADTDRILKSARHLLELINGILDLSKVEAGKMELYVTEIDLRSLMTTIVDLVRPAMDENSNQVVLELADNISTMYSDEIKIRQILFNLLSNAAKFTHSGSVRVIVEQAEYDTKQSWINITIEDTGIGMTEEQQSLIFNDFTQADVSTTRKYGGTGLGLSITQRFCAMLGGSITVISRENEGSTFFVELPRVCQQPERDPDSEFIDD